MNATDGKYVIIYGWMRDLDLTLTETMAYALVYGYAKNGEPFQGSITYMQQWLRCTRHTAIKAMQVLEDKGLLRKEQVMVKGSPNNRYYITEVSTSAKNALVGSAEIALEVVQPLHQGSAKNALGVVQKMHYINNKDNNKDNILTLPTHVREKIEVIKKWLTDNALGTESLAIRNQLIQGACPIEEIVKKLEPYVEQYYTEQLEQGKGEIEMRGRIDILSHFANRLPAYIRKEKEQQQKQKDNETSTDPITRAMQDFAAGWDNAERTGM